MQRESQGEMYHVVMNNRELIVSFPCLENRLLLSRSLRSTPMDFYKYINLKVEKRDQFIAQIPYTKFLTFLREIALTSQPTLKTSNIPYSLEVVMYYTFSTIDAHCMSSGKTDLGHHCNIQLDYCPHVQPIHPSW